jgi:hypothetical protein
MPMPPLMLLFFFRCRCCRAIFAYAPCRRASRHELSASAERARRVCRAPPCALPRAALPRRCTPLLILAADAAIFDIIFIFHDCFSMPLLRHLRHAAMPPLPAIAPAPPFRHYYYLYCHYYYYHALHPCHYYYYCRFDFDAAIFFAIFTLIAAAAIILPLRHFITPHYFHFHFSLFHIFIIFDISIDAIAFRHYAPLLLPFRFHFRRQMPFSLLIISLFSLRHYFHFDYFSLIFRLRLLPLFSLLFRFRFHFDDYADSAAP